MKKILICILTAALSAPMSADDWSYFILENTDGTIVQLTAIGTELTFEGTNIVATNAATGQTATIALADLSLMYFSDHNITTSIAGTETKASIGVHAGRITVSAPAGSHVTVYTTAGAVVADTTVGTDGATAISHTLPRGIYLVKINETATKISVR